MAAQMQPRRHDVLSIVPAAIRIEALPLRQLPTPFSEEA